MKAHARERCYFLLPTPSYINYRLHGQAVRILIFNYNRIRLVRDCLVLWVVSIRFYSMINCLVRTSLYGGENWSFQFKFRSFSALNWLVCHLVLELSDAHCIEVA